MDEDDYYEDEDDLDEDDHKKGQIVMGIVLVQVRMVRTMAARMARKQRIARLPIFMLAAFRGNELNESQSQCSACVHILSKVRQLFLSASPPSLASSL